MLLILNLGFGHSPVLHTLSSDPDILSPLRSLPILLKYLMMVKNHQCW
jgi:hypothetical protein